MSVSLFFFMSAIWGAVCFAGAHFSCKYIAEGEMMGECDMQEMPHYFLHAPMIPVMASEFFRFARHFGVGEALLLACYLWG